MPNEASVGISGRELPEELLSNLLLSLSVAEKPAERFPKKYCSIFATHCGRENEHRETSAGKF